MRHPFMKKPKQYREEIYDYIESLLGRPLTFEEHDDLRDMMTEYVFSSQNMSSMFRKMFCSHDWISDKKIEGGQRTRVHVKCSKCDKRSYKEMPTISMRI
jgi:hypothetical protein